MAFELRTAQLESGLSLPYVEQGDANAAPVLLVHAYVESWRSFETLLQHLPSSIRAIALTQRGHGDADKPTAGYGLHELAPDLAFVPGRSSARLLAV
jgi:non-heme chloroperoxidase